MKNIHLLPTDKPSRLFDFMSTLMLTNNVVDEGNLSRHIYITSDEEITGFENNIWVIKGERIFLWQNTMALVSNNKPKKIILTTDQDLIKDGVQAIDDEFLEWFVKNPNCENVVVKYQYWKEINDVGKYTYKIIIPKEEPKCTCKEHDPYCCQIHGTCPTCVKQEEPKIGENSYEDLANVKSMDNLISGVKEEPKQECTCENPTDNTCDYCEKENKIKILEEAKKRALEEETLEEVAERYAKIYRCPATNDNEYCRHDIISAINFGAKWQAERMYTEEDMIKFAEFVASYPDKNRNYLNQMLHAKSKYDGSERTIDLFGIWFKQFKNK